MCDFAILVLSWKGNTILGNANVYAWVIKFLKVELDLLFWYLLFQMSLKMPFCPLLFDKVLGEGGHWNEVV